jgi:hypothetical protein
MEEQARTVEIVDEEDLGAYQLLLRAEEFWEALEPEEADRLFRMALGKDPALQESYISYCEFLKDQNRGTLIKAIISQAIPQSEPFPLYKKYFILAEQHSPLEALPIYKAGLECGLQLLEQPASVLLNYNLLRHESHQLTEAEVRKDLSVACAAVAELCMSHLLHVRSTKRVCETALERGRGLHDGVDIGCQHARYLLLTGQE